MAGGKSFYFKQLRAAGIWNWYDLWETNGKLISFSDWQLRGVPISQYLKLEVCGYSTTQEVNTDGYNRNFRVSKMIKYKRVTRF